MDLAVRGSRPYMTAHSQKKGMKQKFILSLLLLSLLNRFLTDSSMGPGAVRLFRNQDELTAKDQVSV